MCVCNLQVTVSGLPSSRRHTGKWPALCSRVECKHSCGWHTGGGAGDKHWGERGRACGSCNRRGSTARLPDEPGSFQEGPQALLAYLQPARDCSWRTISAAVEEGLRQSHIALGPLFVPAGTRSASGVRSRGECAKSSVQSGCHILWNVNCDEAEEGD